MNNEIVSVRANVRLLSTVEGGRTSSIKGSYRPNHNFFGPNDRDMTIGFIDLPVDTELHPGDSIDLPITLWNWPGLEGQIYPGREWRIQEGAKLVGICLIPRFDGVILSLEWKEAIWDRYVTGAPRPRTSSEQQYSDRRLRSRR